MPAEKYAFGRSAMQWLFDLEIVHQSGDCQGNERCIEGSTTQSSCLLCDKGRYSTGDAELHPLCAGRYKSSTGQSKTEDDCIACGAGNARGARARLRRRLATGRCGKGKFSSSIGQTTAESTYQPRERGKYQDEDGKKECKDCNKVARSWESELTTSGVGSKTSNDCFPTKCKKKYGLYKAASDSSICRGGDQDCCVACDSTGTEGRFSDSTSDKPCLPLLSCKPGQGVYTVNGKQECKQCPSKKYNKGENSFPCHDLVQGIAFKDASSVTCAPGFITDEAGIKYDSMESIRKGARLVRLAHTTTRKTKTTNASHVTKESFSP